MQEVTRIIRSDGKLTTRINRCCMTASPGKYLRLPRMIVEQRRQKNVTEGFHQYGQGKPFSQNQNLRALDSDAGEGSRLPRSGIDVDPVVSNVGMRPRRMAMNDKFSVVPCRVEELVTNPEQVIEILPLDRDARPNAGMYKQEISAAKAILEALQEQFVCPREGAAKATVQVDFSFDHAPARINAIG